MSCYSKGGIMLVGTSSSMLRDCPGYRRISPRSTNSTTIRWTVGGVTPK
jgi:hypothetical protein